MSHLVYSLEYRWNLWLASKQQNLTKIMGCYSHDYVSHVSLLATGERDTGMKNYIGLEEASFHLVKVFVKILMAGNGGQLPQPGGAHKPTISKKNLRTSIKEESWGNEHWQQPKWTWNPIFPQLSYQNKCNLAHSMTIAFYDLEQCPAKPCRPPDSQKLWQWMCVCFFQSADFW